jgi:hypothetical protein
MVETLDLKIEEEPMVEMSRNSKGAALVKKLLPGEGRW